MFPPRPSEPDTPPPLGEVEVLEVFHFILPPDRSGDALCVMAPPKHVAGLAPSELHELAQAAGEMVKQRGDYLASAPNRYLHASVMLGFRVVHLYVTWMMVDASRLGERFN